MIYIANPRRVSSQQTVEQYVPWMRSGELWNISRATYTAISEPSSTSYTVITEPSTTYTVVVQPHSTWTMKSDILRNPYTATSSISGWTVSNYGSVTWDYGTGIEDLTTSRAATGLSYGIIYRDAVLNKTAGETFDMRIRAHDNTSEWTNLDLVMIVAGTPTVIARPINTIRVIYTYNPTLAPITGYGIYAGYSYNTGGMPVTYYWNMSTETWSTSLVSASVYQLARGTYIRVKFVFNALSWYIVLYDQNNVIITTTESIIWSNTYCGAVDNRYCVGHGNYYQTSPNVPHIDLDINYVRVT